MDGLKLDIFDARSEVANFDFVYATALLGSRQIAVCRMRLLDNWVWINDLFVHDDYRREGVASNLLELCLEKAGSFFNAPHGFLTNILPANVPSQALFRKFGFWHVYSWKSDGQLEYLYSRPYRPALSLPEMFGEAMHQTFERQRFYDAGWAAACEAAGMDPETFAPKPAPENAMHPAFGGVAFFGATEAAARGGPIIESGEAVDAS